MTQATTTLTRADAHTRGHRPHIGAGVVLVRRRPATDHLLDGLKRTEVGLWIEPDADHAVHLVRRTALAENIATMDTKPVLHGDHGSTLKATTVLALLQWLGVKP